MNFDTEERIWMNKFLKQRKRKRKDEIHKAKSLWRIMIL